MLKITEIHKGNMPEKKLRVAAYCRVSTDKAEQQHSFIAQQMYFQKKFHCSETEELAEIYADTASGTSICRPGFQRLITDCRSGKIDRIIVKSLSRFARNTKECLSILRELKRIGVTVLFEKESIDTAKVSDEIMITVMEGLAQEESASISRNIRWSIKRKMASGTLGVARVPYGFKKVGGHLEIDEERAVIIRKIFSMYLSGFGARRIALQFNDEHIPSPTNTKWNNVTILKMLRQEKYIGDIRWQKTYSTFMGEKWKINKGEQDSYYIRDCIPAIISREDFCAAQEIMLQNTRQSHKTNSSPFRGKNKCIRGRSFCFRNSYRHIWECCGKYDQTKHCSCPVFLDSDYHAAWKRMCIKLKKFSSEIIGTAAQLFEAAEYNLINDEIMVLREQEEELSKRKYVLCSLCSQGCISTEKLVVLQNEINADLEVIEKKLSVLEKQNDETINELTTLNRLIARLAPDKLADNILKKAVTDGITIEFELSGGLKLREVL